MGVMNDLFHKGKREVKKDVKKVAEVIKPSKPRSMIEAELKAELDQMEKDYKRMIRMQFQIRNEEGISKGSRERAEAKIELCLGALNLIKLAKEDLRDATTAALLANEMRGLGKSLRVMNRLYSTTPSVKSSYLNKQIRKMNHMSEQFNEDMDIRGVMESNSMEGMGTNWQKKVEQVLAGELTVDEFVKRSDDEESPYITFRRWDVEDDHSYLDDLDEYEPAEKGIEHSVDRLDASAKDLDDLDSFNKSMGDIY